MFAIPNVKGYIVKKETAKVIVNSRLCKAKKRVIFTNAKLFIKNNLIIKSKENGMNEGKFNK